MPEVKSKLRGKTVKSSSMIASMMRGITAPAGRYGSANAALAIGSKIRDTYIQYPILPGAITTFQQIASSREWVVTGEPEKASKSWDYLQRAETTDPMSGMTEYGFEQYQKRRILDYTLIGRTAFASRRKNVTSPTGTPPVLKYIDPVNLSFNRQNMKTSVKDGIRPPNPTEKVWLYHGIEYSFEDVVINHPIPQGTRSFVAPVFAVLPMANLIWLLREHDMSSMDGRRIRDIILVQNTSIQDALEDAIHISAGLWNGDTVEDIGLPIVEINNPTGTPVQDMIATLGISKVPDGMDREEVIFEYVNEISGNLGLALRHFWNNEKTTNKALEQVQEQRQQQKGPSAYVRTEQRLINACGFLNRLDGDEENKVRFTFIEETDAAIMSTRADVLKKTTEALEKAQIVFGARIRPEDYLAWMQSERVLPSEMTLQDIDPELIAMDSDDNSVPLDGETSLSSDPSSITIPDQTTKVSNVERNMKYGHVMVNQDGTIIATRKKSFTVATIRKKLDIESKTVTEQEVDEQIRKWAIEGDGIAYTKVSEIHVYEDHIIHDYLKLFDDKKASDIMDAVDYVVSNIQLDENQGKLIEDLYTHIIDVQEGDDE